MNLTDTLVKKIVTFKYFHSTVTRYIVFKL